MAERPYVAGAVAVGVVAAALHLGTGSAPQTMPASSVSSGGGHVRHAIAQQPIRAFDSVAWETEMKNHPEHLGKLTAEKELKDTIDDFLSGEDASASTTKIEVMIAIEPDPVHTHLSLLFDRDIDAIEDALQASGYQYQASWLPWSPPAADSATGDHFIGQEQRRLFLEGREAYPGVILFRPDKFPNGTSQPPKLPLAVFVVGNSPTGGIDRAQFEEAISSMRDLPQKQDDLRILGPTFSGSGPSLRSLLSGLAVAKQAFRRIEVASGAVTDSQCGNLLPLGFHDPPCSWSNSNTQITFVSFGVDKNSRTRQIRCFLQHQGHFKQEQIAELTEDESKYGSSSGDDSPYLHLYFPRNISHLSSAYQKNNIFGFGVSSQGSSNLSLNLDFNEASDEDDTVSNFAQQQMPVSQDGVMHGITAILEQRHIKVVVLSATDVLDELFVAEILAREAPNALVLINQADNLFLRSTSPNDFANMYFVSPFPLIGFGKPRNLVFPSDTAEGLYAATRYLYPPKYLDPDKPHLPYLPDYSSPVPPVDRPALWLSAVGHGSYWPIAVISGADPHSAFHLPPIQDHFQVASGFEPDLPHLSQDLLLICLFLLSVYHTAKCLGLSVLKDFSFGYAINDNEVRLRKLWLQLGITVLLLLALLLSVSPRYHPPFAEYVLYAGAAALSLAGARLLCLLLFWPFAQRSANSTADLLLAATAVIWLFVFRSWPLLWDWLSKGANLPMLLQYRASYPLRGVSPIFPLFITVIAFCILAYSHLDRIAFTRDLRPRLPQTVDHLLHCPSEPDLEPVGCLLEWPAKPRTVYYKTVMFCLILLLLWFLLKPLHLEAQMFDGPRLQNSIGLAMFFLVAAILWELLMASALWQRLKALCLEPLEASPLRCGFSSISGFTWSSLWIFRGSLSSRYRIIRRLLDQASRGVLFGGPPLDKDASTLQHEINSLDHVLDPKAEARLPVIVVAFGRVQDQIAVVAYNLLSKLRDDWDKEQRRITACDATGDEENKKCKKPDDLQQIREEWVALVYLHYIRMVLLQVRSRLITSATLYVFLVWAATSYPYLNRHVLLIALAVILGLLSFAGILIYASINRDSILSRATKHQPGELDLDFYLKTVPLIGVPVIGLIASQFPEVSGFLFSWLEPGMAAVR